MMDIYEEYFNWLVDSLNLNAGYKIQHYSLFKALHNISYEYFNVMDENRYQDGIDLRYRFGSDTNIPYYDITECIDICECSVLEMLVALILKIDNMITYDPKDSLKAELFVDIAKSLGINEQINANFNQEYVNQCIFNWLHGQYEVNGQGGIITVQYPRQDMRTVDHWTQVMWYVNEKLGGASL